MSNLIVPTSEQARKNGSMGGKKRAENARKRKAMKEQLEIFLSLPLKNEKAREMFSELGVDINNLDNQMAITIALCQKALKGDVKAIEMIRDMVDGKPPENVNLSGSVNANNPYANLTTEELREIIKQGTSDG